MRRHLAAGVRGERPGDGEAAAIRPANVETVLLASVRTAVAAAVAEARRQGFHAVEGELDGEAAARPASWSSAGAGAWREPRSALVLGGETTVTLLGRIRPAGGGRNQELALAAARALAGRRCGELVLTLATDGEDGPTRSAGATVDGGTWEAIRRAGIDPRSGAGRPRLAARRSPPCPARSSRPAPTGTNVGDLAVYLRRLRELLAPRDWDSIAATHDREVLHGRGPGRASTSRSATTS